MNNVKVLFYDLEVSPILGWVYGTYNTNVLEIERHSHIMCFSYKWAHQKRVKSVSQIDFPARYKADPTDDLDVVKALWRLFDEADVVVGHNAKGFDNKVGTSRFIVHKMDPPSPYKTIDTLTVARQKGRFSSNKLDLLGQQLSLGRKTKATHSQLWKGCLQGNKSDWKKMITYCNQDVKLLESLYERFKPYISNHPTLSVFTQEPDSCPRCGSHKIEDKGYRRTNTGLYKRYRCRVCRGYMRERVMDKEETVRPTYLAE